MFALCKNKAKFAFLDIYKSERNYHGTLSAQVWSLGDALRVDD